MRKSIALAVIVLLALAANAFAIGEARITGKVVDTKGNPVPDAKIEVKATEAKTFNATFKTDAKGNFAIFLLDGTIHYEFTFSKDGVGAYKEIMKLKLVPEKNERTITLMTGAAAAATGEGEIVQPKPDPAVVAYNEGVELANAGEDQAAIAKFEESISLKPELSQGYIALAKMHARLKNWDKAITNGEKGIALKPGDPDTAAVLAQAYAAKGDKAKAAEYKKIAPTNPTDLFNDAAKAINAGKDSEAEPLLQQAIAADATFAKAYYELGMVYVRSGKTADAKTNLEKYLELEPAGKDAPTAKEMLKYLK